MDCTCAQPCRPVVTCQWMAQRCSLQLTRICIKAIFFLPLSDIFGRCRGMWMLSEPQCVRNFTVVHNRELGSSRGAVAKSRMKHCPEFGGAARSQCCTFESFRNRNDVIVQLTTWKGRSCRSVESSGVMGHSVTFR